MQPIMERIFRNASALIAAIIMVAAISSSCGSKKSDAESAPGHDALPATESDTARHPLPDTLRVATLYSPTSYFIYRETPMGYDYDMISRFCADKNMVLDLQVAPNLNAMVEMLDSGKVDLVAYEIPITSDYTDRVEPCGPQTVTHQVLVQPKPKKEGKRISDVTQLVGREVYVEANSKYHQRLINLNTELGGGIIIKAVDRDTLITEELIAMVSDGDIPLTVVDSDIAKINRTYFSDLDITLEISFPQRAAWGTSHSNRWLADSVDSWLRQEKPSQAQAELLKQYFEKSKESPSVAIRFSKNRMSPFDHLFRQYAATIHWDWRLLAAMGFTESRYDSTQVSWAGARGVMQLMPSTARAYGLGGDRITHNRDNIATAAKVIASLDSQFAKLVSDPEERKKFIVAAYNSGPAHILDAIALAKKHGYDSQRWIGSVEHVLMMKSKPEFYNDPVCRYGYFNGRQTFDYVHHVFDTYSQALKIVSR